ncbi:probable low affinity copper uptake protein 2 [Triplophysa rosa]|uniref:Copper transport protein n=1 Tax=Triplophysa rosa TaxID=992332 RepID=A0A9W7TGZ7_TRIRA|nr:probable low affinity copper uptake protein 2 [Triplophysa rosa]KAI7795907.1 putative low affinity copper uptake protein 2 [Triplophysa rosa]
MNMHFEGSTSVTLLFDFWKVHGPAGMVLSVFVVLLLTVFYELLKVWKITLEKQKQSHITHPSNPVSFTPDHSCFAPVKSCQDGNSALASSRSEISLAPTENMVDTAGSTSTSKSWLFHSLQTAVHMLQVTLGYMLMLCVMSYNVWIFLGVILGSVLGYFLAFPLLKRI